MRYSAGHLAARSSTPNCPHKSRTSVYIRKYRTGWRCEVEKNGRRLSKTFETKREAQQWGIEQEASAKAIGKGWRTFAQAVEKYRETHVTRSARWEENTLARLTEHFGADTPLGTLSRAVIVDWKDKRLKTVSASTVLREGNLLRHMLRKAVEWEWIIDNPCKGIEWPRENPPRHQVWRWQLIKRVLRAKRTGKTAEMQLAFHIALRTGMRLSEVLNSPAGLDARRRVVVLDTTKTGGRAEVPVGRIAARLIAGAKFTVNANEGSVLFGKLCRELLIEGLTFHDARATALTLLSRKVDVLTLSKISRHRDLRILRDHYYRESAEQIAARI